LRKRAKLIKKEGREGKRKYKGKSREEERLK
jgi:hypothetical protein